SGAESGLYCAGLQVPSTDFAPSTNFPSGMYAIYLSGTGATGTGSKAIRSDWTLPSTFAGSIQTAKTLQTTAVAFSALPTCNGGAEGSQQEVTDSTTNTWGATITGSGTNHVLAYCDGTNWTVAAK